MVVGVHTVSRCERSELLMRSCRATICTPLTMRLGAGNGRAEGRGGGSGHWSRVGKRWEGFVLVDMLLLLMMMMLLLMLMLHTAGLSWPATQLRLNVIIVMPENANNTSVREKLNQQLAGFLSPR